MNIHPIFVHVPIAFLTVYALTEFLRLRILQRLQSWTYLKTFLLFIGLAGAFFALQTGDVASELVREGRNVVHLHEFYAKVASVLFGLLFVHYLALLGDQYVNRVLPASLSRWWNVLFRIQAAVFTSPVIVLLALAGLIALTVTGALGGILVYGVGLDPLTNLVGTYLLGK